VTRDTCSHQKDILKLARGYVLAEALRSSRSLHVNPFTLVPCWLLFLIWNCCPAWSEFPVAQTCVFQMNGMFCSRLWVSVMCDVKLSHMRLSLYASRTILRGERKNPKLPLICLVLVYMKNCVIIWQIVQVLYMTCPLFFHFFSV